MLVHTSVWPIGRQPEQLGRPAISQRTCTAGLRRRLLAVTRLVANGDSDREQVLTGLASSATRGPLTAVVLAKDETIATYCLGARHLDPHRAMPTGHDALAAPSPHHLDAGDQAQLMTL